MKLFDKMYQKTGYTFLTKNIVYNYCYFYTAGRPYIRTGDIFYRPSLNFFVSPVQFFGVTFVARSVFSQCFSIKIIARPKNHQKFITRHYIRPLYTNLSIAFWYILVTVQAYWAFNFDHPLDRFRRFDRFISWISASGQFYRFSFYCNIWCVG